MDQAVSFSGLLVCNLATATILSLICWQDWHQRSVSWPAFPLVALGLLACRLGHEPLALVWQQSIGSLLVLTLLLGTLWLYVRLRFRTTGLGLADCLGSGDMLFWLALAVYLPPAALLVFLLGSSLIGLALVALRLIRPLPGQAALTIPLAGLQAACLLLLLGSQWLFPAWASSLRALEVACF